MVFLLPFVLVVAELIWQIIIGYPPTIEQLDFGVKNPAGLWVIRIISLIFIILSIHLFSIAVSQKSKRYYWIFILAVPAISLIWMCYPIDAFKLFLISLSFYAGSKFKKGFTLATVFGFITILILNLGVFKQNPKILETLSLSNAQAEVTNRFVTEDSIKPNIHIPTLVRRIGYNKYYISLKNSTEESLNFLDMETVFFQEVHPLDQKAFVIFFWPEIFIFCIALYLISIKKILVQKSFLVILLLSFIYFLTTNSSQDLRLILIIFPFSLLMSDAVYYILSKKEKLIKALLIFFIFLSFYGWLTDYYDRFVRPSFWLDNRPIAYGFVLSNLQKTNPHYNNAVVSEALYAIDEYCPYYLKKCGQFNINNFDLFLTPPQKDTLYVGFTGNLLGVNSKDAKADEIKRSLNGRGMEILNMTPILNNIANGYGQELIIAKSR